jgi:ABC-type glycerol-3-phosphate transport system substrate-binding protein
MRIMRMISAFVLVLMILAACGASGGTSQPGAASGSPEAASTAPQGAASTAAQTSGEVVEVTFGFHDTQVERPWYTAQIDAANKLLAPKNIRIKGVPIPGDWSQYHQKFLAQLAAGRAPDILNIAESEMPDIITKGQALEITDYVNQLDKSKYFESTFQSAGAQDGKYFGLPSSLYYLVMYFNKDLFDKAGVPYPSQDWNNAWTFEQTADAAKQLTQGEGGNKTFGFAAGPYMGYMGMYSKANGGTGVYNADHSCALTEPAAIEVYKWFDTLLRVDKSMPTPQDQAVIGGFDLFKAGRIGMFVDGNWFQPPMNEINNFKVGIAALPRGKGDAFTTMFVNNWFISKGTKNPEAAIAALDALFSKESWEALAEQGGGGIPVHREVYEAYKDKLLGPQFTAEDRQAFVEAIDHVLALPYDEKYAEVDNKVNATLSEWLSGDITSEQYAERVCSTLNAAYGKQ